MMSNT